MIDAVLLARADRIQARLERAYVDFHKSHEYLKIDPSGWNIFEQAMVDVLRRPFAADCHIVDVQWSIIVDATNNTQETLRRHCMVANISLSLNFSGHTRFRDLVLQPKGYYSDYPS